MKKTSTLTFLGSGSAFTTDNNYHSNVLIENESSKKFLIDSGTDLRLSLHAQGLSYPDIQNVYISHLHADHCGGLEWLGFTHKFDPECSKPNLYLHSSLVDPLWQHRLKGGMQTLTEEEATLQSYFEVHTFENGFEWECMLFEAVRTHHVYNKSTLLPSFGLRFKLGETRIFITADTRFIPEIMNDYYLDADLIFHDCETTRVPSGVHSHYDELKTLPLDIKKKTWLYHFNPGQLPNAVSDGFCGFVKRGQKFEFSR